MAKIGTVHIEIKPVLDANALNRITESIAVAVRAGVRRGMHADDGEVIGSDMHECPADGSEHENSANCSCAPTRIGHDAYGRNHWQHH